MTIAIPVKNEELNLAGCIDAIGRDFAKNIVVIDSGSTDKTAEIAVQRNVKVIDFIWDGKFPKKRNWFLQNHTPDTKWVLFLDADEYITPNFKKELRAVLSDDEKNQDISGYWLNYTIYFLGKKLRGGYPLKKLALFKVGAGEYERIEENQWSKMDMEIHEHPVLTGKTSVIKSKIDHRDFRGISSYMDKHNEYAAWEAARFADYKTNKSLQKQYTWKQRLKYKLINSVMVGPVFFVGSYFFMGGFRDGARGFAFAIFKMAYFTQIYCRLKERK
ncbi:MAG TPA: glycosyltransferase family 2 protein [Aequorivita sp.]|nr:glycosyltransferase family 2 protein [Aequorivita sp.]